MGKVRGKHRLDKFYRLSKEVGYRSRAAFKLIQLDAKYSFLPDAHAVLDLCAAPGSWMQVVVQRIPVGSLVVGVDLVEIKPIRGAFSVQEDITHSKCRSAVKRLLADNHVDAFDVILHDGSPKLGGAWTQSATTQNALVVDSLKLATQFLAPKGTFVTKIFRSQDYNKVLFCLRQLFEKVEVTKPVGSRSTSAEIFIVCRKYKAPAKIDPRLLDIKHLFKEAIEPEKVIDVLRDSKPKRSRGGYKDDLSLVRKDCFAADFVWSENPLELLGTATVISFNDPESLPIKNHELTTEEIEALCDDLGVLGKKDFKQLLKWRMNIRKALSSSKEPTSTSVKSVNEPKGDEGEVDEDKEILNEMEDLTHNIEVKKKREKFAKRAAKDKAGKALGKLINATEDGYVDEELFSLASIKGKKDLITVDDVTEDAENLVDLSKSKRNSEGYNDDLSSDLDSDYERMRYDNKLEMLLDEDYERVVERREGSTMQRKRAKRAYKDVQLSDVEADMNLDDSDKEGEDTEANPLVVPMFPDDLGLPKWCMEDVESYLVLQTLLTKEALDDLKARMWEVNDRLVKQIAEANARIAMWQMDKIRKKATTVSDQKDLPDRSKRRMIEQLYKKAAPERPKKKLVLQVRAGGLVLVRRMKSDSRQQQHNKGKK